MGWHTLFNLLGWLGVVVTAWLAFCVMMTVVIVPMSDVGFSRLGKFSRWFLGLVVATLTPFYVLAEWLKPNRSK